MCVKARRRENLNGSNEKTDLNAWHLSLMTIEVEILVCMCVSNTKTILKGKNHLEDKIQTSDYQRLLAWMLQEKVMKKRFSLLSVSLSICIYMY